MAKETVLSEWKSILGSLMVLAFLLFVRLWPFFCLLLAAAFGVGWLSRGWRDRPSSNTDGDLPELISHLEGIFHDVENIYLKATFIHALCEVAKPLWAYAEVHGKVGVPAQLRNLKQHAKILSKTMEILLLGFIPLCREYAENRDYGKLSQLGDKLSFIREAVDYMMGNTALCAFENEGYQSALAKLENTRAILQAFERTLEAQKANTDPSFDPMLIALMLGASQEWIRQIDAAIDAANQVLRMLDNWAGTRLNSKYDYVPVWVAAELRRGITARTQRTSMNGHSNDRLY